LSDNGFQYQLATASRLSPAGGPLNGWHLGTDPLCEKCLERTSEAIEKNKKIFREMR